MPKNATIEERWREKVAVRDDGCWEWTASRDQDGYGRFQYPTPSGQKHTRAHRWAYEHFVGPIPSELQVCHTCDRPWCVNPAHLWLGTNAQNDADKRHKGRAPAVWGEPLNRSRRTHCKRGHAFTPENTYWDGRHRNCRSCRALNARKSYWRTRGMTA